MQKGPLSVQAQKEQSNMIVELIFLKKGRLKAQREQQLQKKEQQLNKLTDEEVIQQLKLKNLGVYGTKQEKLDRLKKANNIPEPYTNEPSVALPVQTPQQPAIQQPKAQQVVAPKSNVVENIKKMEQKREERRNKMEEMKQQKLEREQENIALGKNVDTEFELLIDKNRLKEGLIQEHQTSENIKLCVCVRYSHLQFNFHHRKRPIFKKEEVQGEIDAVSCSNPLIRVHEPKLKVDGITKYVENHTFQFDNTFHEDEDSDNIYNSSIKPILELLFNQGVVTCFAYGQTGSGKTFTMKGIYELLVQDLYLMLNRFPNFKIYISFFEIYGGKSYDLLNNKTQLAILEDKNNNIQIQGLLERMVNTDQELLQMIEYGNSIRTTHATVANDTSSRSHAISWILVKDENQREVGKLILVDLAGSERAQDTQSNNRQRRIEGAEINKSLLALKECIRSMNDGAQHVPFRASKLTLVLRDSFISRSNKSRIVMIACVSPGSSSADHTLNTLRYADRLKDKTNQPKIQIEERGDNNEEQNRQGGIELPKIQQRGGGQYEEQKQLQQQQLQQRAGWNDQNNQKKNNGQQPPQPQSQPQQQISKQPSLPQASNVKNADKQQNNSAPKQQAQQVQQVPQSANQNKVIQNKRNSGQQQQQQNDDSPDDEDINEDIMKQQQKQKDVKDDVRCMKETMKAQGQNEEQANNEFFDFQEKVNTILEEQDEILAFHMAAIKEDAKLLTKESELIQNIQSVGIVDYDVDTYVSNLEHFIKKKVKIYNMLNKKLQLFKQHLQEEEEISSKMKNTFYY